MPEFVLDASALLALINQEPGGEEVRPLLSRSIISAVNYCETIQRLRRGGMPAEAIPMVLTPLISQPVPFDEPLSWVSAAIHEKTRDLGLSLGDCACLALAQSRKLKAVTAERIWEKAEIGVAILSVR